MDIKNPLEHMTGYQLRRSSGAMLARLCESYAMLGLRLTEASVLLVIEANPGLKQSEIGRALDIKSANMAPLIAQLDKLGFITRQKLDGRSQGLQLSDKGIEVVAKVWACVRVNEEWLKEKVSKDNFEQFTDTLKGIWR